MVGAGGRNLRLTLPKLHAKIKPEQSTWSARGDYIVLKLRKAQGGHWTDLKHVAKFNPTKGMDAKEDPQTGLFNMMKRMYEEGDDNMKRTISEAWTKARDGKEKQ